LFHQLINLMHKPYFEHKGKVFSKDKRFKHVMAVTLNPQTGFKDGLVRCVVSREGDVGVSGYIDRSELHKVSGDSLESFSIGERLVIKNEESVINSLNDTHHIFVGLEDPDIYVDDNNLIHVYFTIPVVGKGRYHNLISLGHAEGKNLDCLEMTDPVITTGKMGGAKEVSIAPINRQGFRYNLVESEKREKDFSYSVVSVAECQDMGKPWKLGKIVYHPKEHKIPWIGGHASPGPLFSDSFIDVGKGKRLGVINGREANKKVGGKIVYGVFSVGLFVYDYENGKIDWISEKPFIIDSEAKIITFASQFVGTGKGLGILYAHVDDSFVRAYSLNAEAIKIHYENTWN
jgi:hypothetical protein